MPDPTATLSHHIQSLAARMVIGLARLLPYRWRVPAVGALVSRVVAPLIGWNRRVRDNLALTHPDMPPDEVRRIMRGASDNAGRAIIETYSPEEFIRHTRDAPLTGPGVAALAEAQAAGRPVVVVTGHFGNYDAISVVLDRHGHKMGVLYRPMSNPVFNAHYAASMSKLADRLFPADRQGLMQMVRHLKSGNIVGMMLDLHRATGIRATFLGVPAMTPTTGAEWAVRYDALLLPVYGIRQPDGLSFEVYVDAPIPNTGDIEGMTQAVNDSLERMVTLHMEQWFWIHRRWKGT